MPMPTVACSEWGWRFLDGKDIVGHDLAQEASTNRNECQPKCKALHGCAAYTWRADENRCYLKSAGATQVEANEHAYGAIMC